MSKAAAKKKVGRKKKQVPDGERQSLNRRDLWLSLFLDSDNPETFLNREGAARLAGYKSTAEGTHRHIGCVNFKREKERIKKWMDEEGLSEEALKLKLIELLDATETKFFAHEGTVTDQKEVKALTIQLKALDMALDVRGMKKPQELNHNGKITIEIVKFAADTNPE